VKFNLAEKLRCLIDQPVRIFTDDERMINGMVVGVNGEFVRILDGCGDIFLVSICHVTSVEEPHMHLRRKCCKRNRCGEEEFGRDEWYDGEDGKEGCGCMKDEDRY